MIFGILAITKIPINLLPNIEYPKLTIITAYKNASSQEIEDLITKPITNSLSSMQGLEKIESESIEGFSFVKLKFKFDVDINFALLESREKLDLLKDILPRETEKPIISKFDPSSSSFIEIIFTSKGLSDNKSLRYFIKNNVIQYLERVDGIASIQIAGGFQKEVVVEIDPYKMSSYNISPNDLQYLIEGNNKNYPAGQIPLGNKDILIRAIGEFNSIAEIGSTVLKFDEKGPISISNIGNVYESYKEREQISRYNNEECVTLYLFKEPGKNSVQISNNIDKALKNISISFRNDIEYKVVYNESKFISNSINNLVFNLILGSLLAFLILIVILRNVYSPIILLLTIPVTLFTSFIVFYFFNISFNVMSLGGIALGIGMLFDSSNVVLSGIERNLELNKKLEDAILDGSEEVNKSIISATLTTVIVFFPISFLKNQMGLVFSEMALAIIIVLSISLFVALTLIPLLTYFFYKKRKSIIQKKNNKSSSLELNIFNFQNSIIKSTKKYLLILIIMLITSFLVFKFIKKELFPQVNTGEFTLRITLPSGTKLLNTSEFVNRIENYLLQKKEVDGVLSLTGGDTDSLKSNPDSISNSNESLLRIILSEGNNNKAKQIIEEIKEKFLKKEEVEYQFDSKNNLFSDLFNDKPGYIEYLILGDDNLNLDKIGNDLFRDLKSIYSIDSINIGMKSKIENIELKYDFPKMSSYGISASNLNNFIKVALDGIEIGKMKMQGESFPIQLKLSPKYVASIEDLSRLKIKTPRAETIFLQQLITVNSNSNFKKIIRRGNSRANPILIKINEKGDTDSIKRKVSGIIENQRLPSGFKIIEAGDESLIQDSIKELIESFLLAVLLIYMLLAGQFESFKSSLIMISMIPLIFIGVFPALLFSGKSLNVSSFMGLILLVGIVVDNSSLFYEYYLKFSKSMGKLDSIQYASKTVIRPLVMNNSTTILGMLPLLLELGEGSEFQSPLAVVVVSGLISTSLLTLFVVPVLFFYFTKNQEMKMHD